VVLAVAIVGVVLMVIGTWAWFATALPIAVSFAWLIFRMRAGGFARPVHWLLVAAWPVGMAVLVLLDQLEVGPQDTYGDHSVASVAGFAVAASLFAIGLASLGQWLRTSRPVARDPELAGM
jgi:hypothetical protein